MVYRYIERNCDKAIFAAEFGSPAAAPGDLIRILGPVQRWQAIEDGGSDPSGFDWDEDESVSFPDSSSFPLGWTLVPRGSW